MLIQTCSACVYNTGDSAMRCAVNPSGYQGGVTPTECRDYEAVSTAKQWEVLWGTEYLKDYPYVIHEGSLDVIQTTGDWGKPVDLPYFVHEGVLYVQGKMPEAGWHTAWPLPKYVAGVVVEDYDFYEAYGSPWAQAEILPYTYKDSLLVVTRNEGRGWAKAEITSV